MFILHGFALIRIILKEEVNITMLLLLIHMTYTSDKRRIFGHPVQEESSFSETFSMLKEKGSGNIGN